MSMKQFNALIQDRFERIQNIAFDNGISEPQQKFICDVLPSLLSNPSPYASDIARNISGNTTFESRENRVVYELDSIDNNELREIQLLAAVEYLTDNQFHLILDSSTIFFIQSAQVKLNSIALGVNLVVASNQVELPMLLITNIPINNVNDAEQCFYRYMKRWDIETFFQCVKQKYSIEKRINSKFCGSPSQTKATLKYPQPSINPTYYNFCT